VQPFHTTSCFPYCSADVPVRRPASPGRINDSSAPARRRDAADEARGLAELYLATHRVCNGSGGNSVHGFYLIRLFCTGSGP